MSSRPKDRHHIIPKARCRQLGISPNFRGNVVSVTTTKHRAWHTLFGAATPEEAICLIKAEWSLSDEGQAEFKKLTENVRLFRRKQ